MDTETDLRAYESLRDRMLCAVVTAVQDEACELKMTMSSQAVMAMSDVVLKFLEQLGCDVELFAQHAGRKSVNMDDVILTARRNPSLVANLMPVVDELVLKSQAEKMKKKQDSGEVRGEKSKRGRKDLEPGRVSKLKRTRNI